MNFKKIMYYVCQVDGFIIIRAPDQDVKKKDDTGN